MPSVAFVDVATSATSEKTLNDEIFGVKPNRHIIYEAVRHYRARRHRGTHATKNRSAVSGGGAKPWRQKGTGRARVGSNRTPLWRKGGTVFGPQPRDYGFKLSGKVQSGALRSALSLRAGEKALTVVGEFPLEKPNTKTFLSYLKAMGVDKLKLLVVEDRPGESLRLSARNVPGIEVCSAAALHTYNVIAAEHVVLSESAVARLEERLAR